MLVRNVYLQRRCFHTWGKLVSDSTCFEIIGFGSCHFFPPSLGFIYLNSAFLKKTGMDAFQFTPCLPQPSGIQFGNKLPHMIFHLPGHNLEGLGQLWSEKAAWISHIPPSELWNPYCYGSVFKILFLCTFVNLLGNLLWEILCHLYDITKYIKTVKC